MSRTVEEHEAMYHGVKPEPKPAREMPSWAYVGATVHWDGVSALNDKVTPRDVVLDQQRDLVRASDFIGRELIGAGWFVNIEHLSPIPAKPEPTYVVPTGIEGLQNGKPVRLNTVEVVDTAHFRPATAEDFKVTFKGVKVWMEKHTNGIMGRMRGTGYGGGWTLNDWEVDIWKAAGVMFMPEVFMGAQS